jgi:succinate-semialdehyde dehydrogenase/glutarate-semialdehyde dehydrogenase
VIEVRNPRTGLVDDKFEPPSAAELQAIAARLRGMQHAWESNGLEARTEVMRAWRAALAANRNAIVEALTHDTGRRIESAMEADAILGTIDRWCALAPSILGEEEPRAAALPMVVVRQGVRPYELAGVISPWNFPLLLSLIDAIPALMAGCAVVVKPSEIAPRFTEPLARTFPAELPLAFVNGAGETGAQLIDLVDVVCFTGSVPTGRAVGAQAARNFIPAFLELGGKDPAVVLASADVERATSAVLWGGTANAGQSCLSIERVYVDARIHDEFVDLLAEKARKVRLAAPDIGDGELGPIIAEKQIGVIGSHLRDAIGKGAVARAGGELVEIDGGTYCPATVLTNVTHEMSVMTEETFGPVLPVMPFATVDEAVALANDTRYGLSGAVFAASADEAIAVARRIDAGAISVNDAALTAFVHDGEKNSFHLSGLGGSRMGPASLRRFFRKQAFLVANTNRPDPWWYPHLL